METNVAPARGLILGDDAPFTVELPSDRAAWAAVRQGGIGASNAGAIWNATDYGSPFSLWYEKIYGRPERGEQEEWQLVGEKLEPAIAEIYGCLTGNGVINLGQSTILRSKQWPILTATLDRVIESPDRPGYGVLECKSRQRGGSWDEDLPADVYSQLQHQLCVTGWRWGAVAALLAGRPWHAIVERDDEFIEAHVAKCHTFWNDHVLAKVPPPIDASEATGRALRALYPKDSGDTIQLPGELEEWVGKLKAARERRTAADGDVTEAENHLRAAIGSATAGRFPSGCYVKLATVKGGPVSYVREDYRRLTITEPKVRR